MPYKDPGKNREYNRLYRAAHRAEIRERRRAWAKANPEKVRAHKRDQDRRRLSTPRGRLDDRAFSMIRKGLAIGTHGRRWYARFDFSLSELIAHLENQFLPGMTWGNRGRTWEVDHIIPRSAFIYESPEDPAFRECWALGNLRPLWADENRRRNRKQAEVL